MRSSAQAEEEVLPPEWTAFPSVILDPLGEHNGSTRLTFGAFFVLDGSSRSSSIYQCQIFSRSP